MSASPGDSTLLSVTRVCTRLRTRRHQLMWLVLSVLLLRALIPTGFMPRAGAGGAYLGFCPGAGPAPSGPNALERHTALHHPSHTDSSGGPHAPKRVHHPECIFSVGAAAASAESSSALAATPAAAVRAERAVSLVSLPAIVRTQSSRGPPSRA